MKFKIVFLTVVALLFASDYGVAQKKERIHPRNVKLLKSGLIPYPKYHPSIPRLTATEAKSLFYAKKAVFILISYHDRDKIIGGYHLTEDKVGKTSAIDVRKLPVRKGQILVLYCP